MSRCFCCLFFDLGNSEDKSLLLQEQTSRKISNLFAKQGERQFIEEKHVNKSKKIRPTSPEISVIWANNPETNAVFDKLGLPGIVVRYDKILSEWKCLKDAETEFKQLMGIDQDRNIIECVDSIPPEMRIGFSHGSHDSEYEFYLDIDPLVSLDKLNAPLTNQLRRALHVFAIISRQMGVIQFTGTPIVKDLERLVKLFKQDDEPFVTINGIRHSVELLNSQQVEQAYLIIKDIVSLSRARSHALMDYILQQGDQVDLQVIKDDPKNHKVIIFSKKLTGSSKKKKSGPSNPR